MVQSPAGLLYAGNFTATDIQQIKVAFPDTLLAVERDGTIQVQRVITIAELKNVSPL